MKCWPIIDGLEGEKSLKDAVKGEAYLTRAYGHFMLVNLFAKHYDPETAAQDPGVPYVLEPETEFIKEYSRGTVEDVYDNIEDDLEEGLDLVDASLLFRLRKISFYTKCRPGTLLPVIIYSEGIGITASSTALKCLALIRLFLLKIFRHCLRKQQMLRISFANIRHQSTPVIYW